eukprot:484610-Rhodomonas_salina.2
MSSTDSAYGTPTYSLSSYACPICDSRYLHSTRRSHYCLSVPFAMSGTDVGYCATRLEAELRELETEHRRSVAGHIPYLPTPMPALSAYKIFVICLGVRDEMSYLPTSSLCDARYLPSCTRCDIRYLSTRMLCDIRYLPSPVLRDARYCLTHLLRAARY